MRALKTLIVATATLLSIGACTTAPVDELTAKLKQYNPFKPAAREASDQLAAPADIALPVKGTLVVYIAPRNLARQIRMPESSGHAEYWLEEGKLLQASALRSLGRLFQRVTPVQERGNPYPVATVEVSSGFNPVMGTQSARVTVSFASEKGTPIATLEAKASANGYDEADFTRALDAAFQDIETQFRRSRALVAAFGEAANLPRAGEAGTAEKGAAASPPPSNVMAPPGSPPDSASAANALPKQAEQPRAAAPAPSPQPGASSAAPRASAGRINPDTVLLPIRGELGIYIPPEDLYKQIYVSGAGSNYWFKEGALVQEIASKAFAKHFERVTIVEDGDARSPMVKLESSSGYNPTLGTYYAKVVAEFFADNNEQAAASFTGRATADGQGDAGFENAYTKAFRDVAKQLDEDRALLALLAEAASQNTAAMPAGSRADGGPSSVPIPSTGTLILYMPPSELKKQSVVPAGLSYASYWFEDGKAIQRSAMKAFGKVFARVTPGTRGAEPNPVVTVHGSSSFNPIMKTYSGHVVAVFSAPDGRRLGQFEGKATVDERGQGDAGFDKAYDAAFQAVVDQLVKAGRL